MAIKSDPDVTVAQSTGAATFDGDPVTTEQPADVASTGAVEYAAPGETSVEYHGADAVVNAPTPGPVEVTVSWKAGAQAKVVEPVDPNTAPAKTGRAKTKRKA